VLVDALRRGELDVAVTPRPPDDELVGIETRALADEALTIVARAAHPLARKRSVSLPALNALTWIVPPAGSPLRRDFDAIHAVAGARPPTDLIETVSIVATLALLQTSDALSLLPEGVGAALRGAGHARAALRAAPRRGDALRGDDAREPDARAGRAGLRRGARAPRAPSGRARRLTPRGRHQRAEAVDRVGDRVDDPERQRGRSSGDVPLVVADRELVEAAHQVGVGLGIFVGIVGLRREAPRGWCGAQGPL
jgi:hypothetical protein